MLSTETKDGDDDDNDDVTVLQIGGTFNVQHLSASQSSFIGPYQQSLQCMGWNVPMQQNGAIGKPLPGLPLPTEQTRPSKCQNPLPNTMPIPNERVHMQ